PVRGGSNLGFWGGGLCDSYYSVELRLLLPLPSEIIFRAGIWMVFFVRRPLAPSFDSSVFHRIRHGGRYMATPLRDTDRCGCARYKARHHTLGLCEFGHSSLDFHRQC